jgi:hypothetical protein
VMVVGGWIWVMIEDTVTVEGAMVIVVGTS